jgi:hypothetical protein
MKNHMPTYLTEYVENGKRYAGPRLHSKRIPKLRIIGTLVAEVDPETHDETLYPE